MAEENRKKNVIMVDGKPIEQNAAYQHPAGRKANKKARRPDPLGEGLTKAPAKSEPIDTAAATPGISRWIKPLFVLVLIVLAVWSPLMNEAGRYLYLQDEPQKADIIVLLAGSPVVRTLAAADYYNQHLAPEIWVSRGGIERPELIPDIDLSNFGNSALSYKILESRGVPPSAIIRDPVWMASTMDEAERFKTFSQGKNYKKIILVTSRYHSRRSYIIFTSILGDDVQVISLPSKYDPWQGEKWWTTRSGAKNVVLEYQKLLFFYLERFKKGDK